MNIIKRSWNLCLLFGLIATALLLCTNIDSRYSDAIAWTGVGNLVLAILSGIPWVASEWASRRIKT